MNRIAKELYEEIEELYPPYYEDEMIKLCNNRADIVKNTTYDLTDVFAVVGEFCEETGETSDKDQCASFLFSSVIELLPVNEANARRLYECFMVFDDLNVIFRLVDDFDEFLTEAQRKNIYERAKKIYDVQTVKSIFGIDD